MAAMSKRVFFGSLFDFSKAGAEEVINNFNQTFPASSDAPFASYDQSHKTFSFVCDHSDPTPVRLFLGALRDYIEHEQSRLLLREQEIVDRSPKVQPLEGTTIQESFSLDDGAAEGDQLINDLGEDDDASDDEAAPKPDGLVSITQYWKPASGKISMLTTSFAQEIAHSTGSSLDPEESRNRVRIVGGNFNEALRKLIHLEKLMEYLASQRMGPSPQVSDNVLVLRKDEEDGVISFARIQDTDTFAYSRVLVDETSRKYLDRKYVGELRKREVYNGPFVKLRNLCEIYPTAENRDTKIWADFLYPTLGDEKSLQPVTGSRPTSPDAATQADGQGSPSRYLSVNENRSIEHWTKQITEPIDPTVAAEPPTEEEPMRKATRRVKADSEDEESDDDKAPKSSRTVAPQEATRVLDQMLMGGSESGASLLQEAQLGARQRKVAVSSSGSDDMDDDTVVDMPSPTAPATQAAEISLSSPVAPAVPATGCRSPTTGSAVPIDDAVQEIRRMTFATAGHLILKTNPERSERLIDIDPDETLIPRPDAEAIAATNQHPPSQLINIDTDETPFVDTVAELEVVVLKPAITPVLPESASLQPIAQTAYQPASLGPQSPSQAVPALPISSGFNPIAYRTPNRDEPSTNNQRGIGFRGGRGQVRGGRGNVAPAPGQAGQRGRGLQKSADNGTRGRAKGLPQQHAGRNRGNSHRGTSNTRGNMLIEISSFPRLSGTVMPPPGINIRLPHPVPSSPELLNIIDDPVENLRRPSLQPTSPLEQQTSPSESSAPSASIMSVNSGRYYVNTGNPGLNIAGIQNEALANLQRMQGAQRRQRQQQRQETDETSTRKFHSTMGQGAPKPGPKHKKPQKQESKQEKQERLARAKNEAYGGTNPAKMQQNLPSHTQGSARNTTMPPEEKSWNKQTEDLVAALTPLFQAGRAFPGRLHFEIQFGQALVPIIPGEAGKPYSTKGWHALFHPSHGLQPPVATFTNILTTNGADIDRLLETKAPPGKGSVKQWNKTAPGPMTVTYEFHCQSKENEDFWLIVNQDGTHSISKAIDRIGMVNLHYPAHIWDACAVLQGTLRWNDLPSHITTAANTFLDSLYVPPEQNVVAITYRLPTTNEITVRNLVMKRTSLHECLLDGRRPFHLKSTEVKTLYHRFNQKDKKLGQAFEKDFLTMVQDGRLHYEISLVNTGINDILAKNESLTLGELTHEKTTGKKLLVHDKVKDMLDLTTYMVSKMDWMGAHNDGTLPRLEAAAAAIGASRMGGSILPASRMTGAMTGQLVHGVRAGTRAEVFLDSNQLYARGQGGARVPLLGGLEGIGEEDVAPDDSASVAGGRQIPLPRGGHGGVDPRARGQGFW